MLRDYIWLWRHDPATAAFSTIVAAHILGYFAYAVWTVCEAVNG